MHLDCVCSYKHHYSPLCSYHHFISLERSLDPNFTPLGAGMGAGYICPMSNYLGLSNSLNVISAGAPPEQEQVSTFFLL